MTINDLFKQWQDSIEMAQPPSEELPDEQPVQGAGMHVRSDLRAGYSSLTELSFLDAYCY
jgi:hypothetical protein